MNIIDTLKNEYIGKYLVLYKLTIDGQVATYSHQKRNIQTNINSNYEQVKVYYKILDVISSTNTSLSTINGCDIVIITKEGNFGIYIEQEFEVIDQVIFDLINTNLI